MPEPPGVPGRGQEAGGASRPGLFLSPLSQVLAWWKEGAAESLDTHWEEVESLAAGGAAAAADQLWATRVLPALKERVTALSRCLNPVTFGETFDEDREPVHQHLVDELVRLAELCGFDLAAARATAARRTRSPRNGTASPTKTARQRARTRRSTTTDRSRVAARRTRTPAGSRSLHSFRRCARHCACAMTS